MILGVWGFQGPSWTGLAVFPASWSDEPLSCMAAPAGMGRVEFFDVSLVGGLSMDEPSGAVAAVFPLGLSRFSLGSGAGWNSYSRTGAVQLSGSYVVTGDPIGFMEGLFGPSITTGLSVRYIYGDGVADSPFEMDAGFQFSLFPSFAIGMNCTDITNTAALSTGFSTVFNRSLKGHVCFCDQKWQLGCELKVSRNFRLYSGTDGESVHASAEVDRGLWRLGYGVVLHENSVEHSFGLSRSFQ